MAKEGRHLFKVPPYGYRKEGENKARRLVIEEGEALIVKFIYDAYLRDIPLYKLNHSYGLEVHRFVAD